MRNITPTPSLQPVLYATRCFSKREKEAGKANGTYFLSESMLLADLNTAAVATRYNKEKFTLKFISSYFKFDQKRKIFRKP